MEYFLTYGVPIVVGLGSLLCPFIFVAAFIFIIGYNIRVAVLSAKSKEIVKSLVATIALVIKNPNDITSQNFYRCLQSVKIEEVKPISVSVKNAVTLICNSPDVGYQYKKSILDEAQIKGININIILNKNDNNVAFKYDESSQTVQNETIDNEIEKRYYKIKRLVSEEPELSVALSRTFIELIISRLIIKHKNELGIVDPYNTGLDLIEHIKILHGINIISDDLSTQFHSIRIKGNNVLHPDVQNVINNSISIADSQEILTYVEKIYNWYINI